MLQTIPSSTYQINKENTAFYVNHQEDRSVLISSRQTTPEMTQSLLQELSHIGTNALRLEVVSSYYANDAQRYTCYFSLLLLHNITVATLSRSICITLELD